jgi:RNA polymerase sigma-70 factor (ECF subfamily)
MLGSPHEADDALQNTLLRAWRALPKFRGRSSLRAWLYRIATNVCLDAVAARPRRLEPCDDEALDVANGDAAPEASYERREALELALVAALQHLTPRQRSALILRDVLGFSAKEAAQPLDTTVASVNGALLRARRAVEKALPDPSRQASLRMLRDPQLRALVQRFADALEQGEIDAILALLADGKRSRL